jgi:hypothetical protein
LWRHKHARSACAVRDAALLDECRPQPLFRRQPARRQSHGHDLLISFQAERALPARTRAIINFNRIKTFRKTNDRDLFQIGLQQRF